MSNTYFSPHSRNVAGIQFGDLLRSIGGPQRILKSANAIAWDASVIERAISNDVTRLEVVIRGGATYGATIDTLLKHGQIQQREGRQWVLSLRYWSINGAPPTAHQPQQPQQTAAPAAVQGVLFEHEPVRRRIGGY